MGKHAASQSDRDYMRQYMRDYRARVNDGLPLLRLEDGIRYAAEQSARGIARTHPEGGVCLLCGHLSPVPTCPVCVDEQNRRPVSPAAWEVLMANLSR